MTRTFKVKLAFWNLILLVSACYFFPRKRSIPWTELHLHQWNSHSLKSWKWGLCTFHRRLIGYLPSPTCVHMGQKLIAPSSLCWYIICNKTDRTKKKKDTERMVDCLRLLGTFRAEGRFELETFLDSQFTLFAITLHPLVRIYFIKLSCTPTNLSKPIFLTWLLPFLHITCIANAYLILTSITACFPTC